MKIQLDWLKQYVDPGMEAEELGHLLTMSGLEIEAEESIELSDGSTTGVVELNVTPNRGYCLSHLGVAKEVSALTGTPCALPDVESKLTATMQAPAIDQTLSVSNEAEDLCPRYSALVIEGVKVGPSPKWLADRLTAIGLRPINNVVDITNFVLMEYGQPLHAFDLDKLDQDKIMIRRAKAGEKFEALDGSNLTLDADSLVIADAGKPVALAGVMGGTNSQVTESTTRIALESACFDPVTVRRTSKKFGIRSDSSYRFERGVDIDTVPTAQGRAALLIIELAGGSLRQGRIDLYPAPRTLAQVTYRVDRANQRLGAKLDANKHKSLLTALGTGVEDSATHEFTVTVPSSRPTLTREIDLIEEVARLHGYQNIPTTPPRAELHAVRLSPRQKLIREAKQQLPALGYTEVVNYSFLEEEHSKHFITACGDDVTQTIPLDNPISMDLGTLRTSLLPSLLKTAVRNFNHGQKSVRLFEQGNAYFRKTKSSDKEERSLLAALATGPYPPSVWKQAGANNDYFDIKGALTQLMNHWHLEVSYQPATKSFLQEEMSSAVLVEDKPVGVIGCLSNKLATDMGLETPCYVFELNLDALTAVLGGPVRFQPVPKFPASLRDISILIDKGIPVQTVSEAIAKSGGDILRSVDLYDQFESKKLEAGKKSLTFSLSFQSPDKTLTDNEVNPVFEKIIDALSKELGASLRT